METFHTHPGLRILARIIARQIITERVEEVEQISATNVEAIQLPTSQPGEGLEAAVGKVENSGTLFKNPG